MNLVPHPEGGYYRETYRTGETTMTSRGKRRNLSTAIYYLLENDDKSHFHRLESDEMWFFHQGESMEIVLISDGQEKICFLGNDIDQGETPQVIIPAGTWFAAGIKGLQGYSLVSCTVSPGFDFSDFEMADREKLIAAYPDLQEVITAFT